MHNLDCPVSQIIGFTDLGGVAEETVARKLVGNVLFILAPTGWADAVFHQNILATVSQLVRW